MPSGPSNKPFMRSLRFRLMIWNAAVVLMTACVTLVALREGVRITLLRELDQQLREDLREIEIALGEHEASADLYEQLNRRAAGHAQHQWFAELVGVDGRIHYQSVHAPSQDVWQQFHSQTSGTVDEWRLFVRQVINGGPTIRVGASLRLIHQDIARLDRFVALAAAGVLIAAPLCGYWLAGRATRPLANIIDTTARLRPSRLNERLEIRGTGDELDQLSQKINRLLDRIGNYLQERRDFLANSAHELRTPLAAIRNSIEVALAGGRTREEYEELLAEILEESECLQVLVNQLLLLSETETERLKVDKQVVRLNELVERALDMFSGVAESREIQLVCRALPLVEVRGNAQHLRHVVNNLLDNALKFTPAQGRVTVELCVDSTANLAVLKVQDTGSGISTEELPHVFERFFRGQRARGTPEKRGTGLGLSICQAIVRAHEGKIDVSSQPAHGTRVTVTIPQYSEFCPRPVREPMDQCLGRR